MDLTECPRTERTFKSYGITIDRVKRCKNADRCSLIFNTYKTLCQYLNIDIHETNWIFETSGKGKIHLHALLKVENDELMNYRDINNANEGYHIYIRDLRSELDRDRWIQYIYKDENPFNDTE